VLDSGFRGQLWREGKMFFPKWWRDAVIWE
jgi:hypothetical protein